jgi:hypothetical protein
MNTCLPPTAELSNGVRANHRVADQLTSAQLIVEPHAHHSLPAKSNTNRNIVTRAHMTTFTRQQPVEKQVGKRE